MSRGRVSRQNAIYTTQSTGQFGPSTGTSWDNRHVYNRSVELDDYVVPPRVPMSKLDTGKLCVPNLANTESAVSKLGIIDNEAGRAHMLKSDVNRNRNTNVDINKRDNSKSDYTDSVDKHVKRSDVNRRGNANNSDKTIGDGGLVNHSNNSSKFADHMHVKNSSNIPENTVSGKYTELVYSDADSSIMSAYDKTHYSQQLKEFENMVKTCTDNGEYVYLSQINELRNKGLNTTDRAFHLDNDNESFEKRDALNDSGYLDNGIDIPGWQPNLSGIGYSEVDITGYNADTSGNIVTNSEVEYSYPLKRPKEVKDLSKGNLDKAARNIPNILDVEHGVNVDSANGFELKSGGVNSKRENGHSDDFKPSIVVTDHSEVCMPGITVDAKKDRNDNVLETSSESTADSVNNDHDHQGDNEEDLKKIIQECLWYFHSQVETNRAKGQTTHTKSKSVSDSQKQYIQIDRRYRPLGHARGARPRSLTDLDEQEGGYDRLRPRSMTDTDLTVANTQAMSNGWIDTNKGEGLSVVADVSSVSSQHGSPHHSPRVHTLPPRVPTSRSTNPDIRIDRRETSSLRRRPNLARRSKSAFNMSMTSSEPYAYPHSQHEHISTGRMFIEDVLSDIRQQRSSTGPDIYQPRIGSGLESANMNTNEIKTLPVSASYNGRVPLVTNHVISCPPPRGSAEFKSLKSTKLNATSTNNPVHFKSRSGDSSSSKTIPNLTKNSNFIRSLSQNSILSKVTNTSVIQKSEINSTDKSDSSKSESSSSSSTNSLCVFDIVGEDSGCRYPWQRDATTQYDPPELEIGSETIKEVTDLDIKSEQTSEIHNNQENMKAFEGIIKRQRNFRAKRPHSMGCIDTSSLDANLAGIAEIQNSARSRLSEPLLQSGSFIRKRSSNLSDESGSSVNLESIQENPAELTLRNSVHRNVLSSPSVSPEMWRDAPNRNGAASDLDDSDGQVFESPVGRRKKTPEIRRLVVTGEDPVPVELTSTVTIKREDLRTNHEEADNILAHQMVAVASAENKGVSVISDDTDVFALLLHFYAKQKLTGVVIMESPVKDRITIDIRATVNDNKNIIPDLLAAHALSGCDTTACYFGIGKGTVVKTLRTQNSPLSMLGDPSANFDEVLKESTDFIAACYSITGNQNNMSSVRQKVWTSKVGKSPSCGPKLYSLPPTTESFTENVKRAHLQASVWKYATETDPPEMDPVNYGWKKNEATKSLAPVMLPENVELAPPQVLQLVKCSCASESPCGTLRCSCKSARLSCTMFCACQGGVICSNEQTKTT